MPNILQPYGDLVILARRQVGKTFSGVAVPETSNEGKHFIVVAVGGLVPKNIQPGMSVQIVGKEGQQFAPVPEHKDLIIISAQYVCFRYVEATEEEYDTWRNPVVNMKAAPPQEEPKP